MLKSTLIGSSFKVQPISSSMCSFLSLMLVAHVGTPKVHQPYAETRAKLTKVAELEKYFSPRKPNLH